MINTLSRWLVKIEGWVAAISLMLMLILSIIQVIARNFLDLGFSEIDIINRHLLVICGMMGAVLATSNQQHIKIDALVTVLNKKILSLLRVPVLIFSALICAFMLDYSIIFFNDEWKYAPANERWIVPFTLIYPVGFALLCFHFLMLCRRPDR